MALHSQGRGPLGSPSSCAHWGQVGGDSGMALWGQEVSRLECGVQGRVGVVYGTDHSRLLLRALED